MKLRIKGNSIRLRVTRSEVARLHTAGVVEETAAFGPGESLTYRIATSRTGPPVQTTFNAGQINIVLADERVQHWALSDEVGIYGQWLSMEVAVEKDFRCLSRAEERDDGDVYPNPAADERARATNSCETEKLNPMIVLRRSHREIEDCVSALVAIVRRRRGEPLDSSDLSRVSASLAYFRNQLPLHTADEEYDVFPRLRNAKGAAVGMSQLIDSLEDEHACADTLHAGIDRLFSSWISGPRLRAAEAAELESSIVSLAQVYERHIQAEESKIFPALTHVLPSSDFSALAADMAMRRAIAAI